MKEIEKAMPTWKAVMCTDTAIKQLPEKESSKDLNNFKHDMSYLNAVKYAIRAAWPGKTAKARR